MLAVGDLQLQMRRSERRRTMQITVERDGALTVTAPNRVPRAQLERFVRAKRFWIYSQLAAKEALPPPLRKEFVSGEGFAYLGRKYRLQLVGATAQEVPVRLESGRFKMRRGEAADGRTHLVRWYADHAQPWLTARVERWAARVGVTPGAVTVQDLGFHWGSCGKGGRLFFHWTAIQLPPRLLDYVVAHELVVLVQRLPFA